MKSIGKFLGVVIWICVALSLTLYATSPVWAAKAQKSASGAKAVTDKLAKANASFDVNKMSDMSGFDPSTFVSPTGDTIRIAVVSSFQDRPLSMASFTGASCPGSPMT